MAQSLKTWVAGTSAVCAVVVGLGGFLLVKPQLDEASNIRDQTAELAAANDTLAADVAALQVDFQNIDEYRAALAADRVKVPEQADLSAMLRQIDAVAATTGVTLITSSPGTAQLWVPPAPTAEETPASTEGDAASSAATASPAPEATASPAQGDSEQGSGTLTGDEVLADLAAQIADVDGLYAIPVTIDVVGPYENVRSFLAALQTNDGRYFYAGNFTLTQLLPGEASGGRPAVAPGDVELALAASVFVLTATEGAQAVVGSEPAPDATSAPLPAAPEGKNPFSSAG